MTSRFQDLIDFVDRHNGDVSIYRHSTIHTGSWSVVVSISDGKTGLKSEEFGDDPIELIDAVLTRLQVASSQGLSFPALPTPRRAPISDDEIPF